MPTEIIRVERYCYKAGDFVLRNINLSICKGEIFAILGQTGSGKTLLLESITGYHGGISGFIRINGTDVMCIDPRDRQIGFVYQDFGLFPHMTVDKNIRYGLKMHKLCGKEADQAVQTMAELLSIGHILKQYPGTLSGGERQRVALARALVLNPQILLMDEPFSALDPKTRGQMYDLIEQIHDLFGCTILFVTHNFDEAQRLAGRIGIMVNGELRAICKADELFQCHKDRDIEAFLGGHPNGI
ncbi:ATP-binding cassette domain-containing protein [Ethanoligenens harbinense]|uniref:ATP-binding cassette domain-containing protein n=1 Tax=Ethanoligenens harbinense TaxID=253239 RepID=UPI000EA078D5|nr:ATP-binding cassette domain-containing protein [Ethanoligenens harbinense]AYF41768.1 sulfate transporter [Ethanoligenens harbinense]